MYVIVLSHKFISKTTLNCRIAEDSIEEEKTSISYTTSFPNHDYLFTAADYHAIQIGDKNPIFKHHNFKGAKILNINKKGEGIGVLLHNLVDNAIPC